MATERLYYHDSFLREFSAQVVGCEPAQEGSRDTWRVVLERSSFYPSSGGQPHDTGRLGEANVLNVVDEGETIIHITDRACAEGTIRGVIDWKRRFDHMQQHTGQHLLSAVCLAQLGLPTVSFHLGEEIATIDLQGSEPTIEQVLSVEQQVNARIFEDRVVTIRCGTAEELAVAGIRKKVERVGTLRAIEIEGIDLQPCGGTHVARTGQIGLVLLRKCEKAKQNWRVEFLCGERALRAARGDYRTLDEAAGKLSCSHADLPAMVGRIVEERDTQHKVRQNLAERLAEAEATVLLAAEAASTNTREAGVIRRILGEADAEHLRLLAGKLTSRAEVFVLLASREGGHVVFAKSKNCSGDMSALLRECFQDGMGKGGGTRDFAQGRVTAAERVGAVLENAATLIGEVVRKNES